MFISFVEFIKVPIKLGKIKLLVLSLRKTMILFISMFLKYVKIIYLIIFSRFTNIDTKLSRFTTLTLTLKQNLGLALGLAYN